MAGIASDNGRRYVESNGRRVYISPTAFGESSGMPEDSFFRGSQWNQDTGEVDRTTNWGNIGSLAIGGFLGGVAAPALFAGGTGAAAAPTAAGATSATGGGLLPATSLAGVPGMTAAAPAVAGGTGASMAGGTGALGWLGRGADALGTIGQVASGAAQGSAQQRYLDRRGDLEAGQFASNQQDRQRRAALLSALLSGTQDQSITPGNPNIAGRMPTVTGGARPSNVTGNAESLLALLGQPSPSLPDRQAGAGENLLGGVGLGSSLLGALLGGRR